MTTRVPVRSSKDDSSKARSSRALWRGLFSPVLQDSSSDAGLLRGGHPRPPCLSANKECFSGKMVLRAVPQPSEPPGGGSSRFPEFACELPRRKRCLCRASVLRNTWLMTPRAGARSHPPLIPCSVPALTSSEVAAAASSAGPQSRVKILHAAAEPPGSLPPAPGCRATSKPAS